jgi:hypothetical protein
LVANAAARRWNYSLKKTIVLLQAIAASAKRFGNKGFEETPIKMGPETRVSGPKIGCGGRI